MAERTFGSRILLFRALSDLRRARTPGTIALYIAIAATMLLLAIVPVCGPVQSQLARAHHARPSSIATWTVFQVVPKMYSFGHRIWFSREPLTPYLLSRAGGPGIENQTMWVNHYPIRAARFESARDEIAGRGEEVHVLVRSDYRGRSWISRFVVRIEGAGFVLEPVEDAR
ncbi:MAG TPA: hypothetical protein VIV40_28205 [Kofleriaceae bacterium]